MATISLGFFQLDVNYLHKPARRHTWHYRRQVPTDLRAHYPSPQILKSLKTKDDKLAALRCVELNTSYEIEFDRLRKGLPKQPAPLRHGLGQRLLARYDIHPESFNAADLGAAENRDRFYADLDELLRKQLSQEAYERQFFENDAIPAHLLPEAEQAALELLQGSFSLKASEYPEEYIRLKRGEDNHKFVLDVRNALAFLTKYLPDKTPADYKRHELRTLIDRHRADGMKTRSIQRRLSTLRAMFNKVALELELKDDRHHVFTHFDIPDLGQDSIERQDFSADELDTLRVARPSRVPEVTELMHLMLETGLRINECCGLLRSDLHLRDIHPFLVVHENTFRRLKTKNSQRFIPLVGTSLRAAKEAMQDDASPWLFPRYIDVDKQQTKNGSASGAVNKRLRALLGGDAPTCHSFRHTLQTRLRNAECPKDIRDELGGWTRTLSDRYGSPADIALKADYLEKSIAIRHEMTF